MTAHEAMLPTERALREGVVFAMDVKYACDREVVELPGGQGRFVADDKLTTFLLNFFIKREAEEIDEEGRPFREMWSDDDLREFARENMDQMVFFRYDGSDPPTDVRAIVNLVADACFFGPEIVWMALVIIPAKTERRTW